MFLVNNMDSFDTSWDWLEANQVRVTNLMDDDSAIYDSYTGIDDSYIYQDL